MLLLGIAVCSASERRFAFEVAQAEEYTAEVDLRSTGADWAIAGREAAVALVRLSGKPDQHIVTWGGPVATTYRIFLGKLPTGRHELTVARDGQYSRPGVELEVIDARFAAAQDALAVAHAPVLYSRRNTAGRFSDVPLFAYCERLQENGGTALQYTAIFSNEDGGTSTRTLMARWGRAVDIEYIYKVTLNADGSVRRAIVQGPNHQDIEFRSPYQDGHPLLMPVTDNNMVGAAGDSPLRFQLAPAVVDLSNASRETTLDANPAVYAVMSKELQREGKIRPFGTVQQENISDVRNYLFIDYAAKLRDAAWVVTVALNDGRAFANDLGRHDFAIARDGSVRTSVELPPGTKSGDIASVSFGCVVAPPARRTELPAHSGTCSLQRIASLFFLDEQYRPGPAVRLQGKPMTVPTGQSVVFRP